MTVKFKDSLSAQACVIVSCTNVTLKHLDSTLLFALYTENEWQIFCWPANRSLTLRWQTTVQTWRARRQLRRGGGREITLGRLRKMAHGRRRVMMLVYAVVQQQPLELQSASNGVTIIFDLLQRFLQLLIGALIGNANTKDQRTGICAQLSNLCPH